ncbi:hypothetical protein [Rhodoferax ferrireducens]|uniref:hypothetical protein n=1 Tax=Rhodoferax ferrireducens TaxID=192843 RepID=UPI001300734A|nr:hypothetical protein [Rhodoferax ferrireducens]
MNLPFGRQSHYGGSNMPDHDPNRFRSSLAAAALSPMLVVLQKQWSFSGPLLKVDAEYVLNYLRR